MSGHLIPPFQTIVTIIDQNMIDNGIATMKRGQLYEKLTSIEKDRATKLLHGNEAITDYTIRALVSAAKEPWLDAILGNRNKSVYNAIRSSVMNVIEETWPGVFKFDSLTTEQVIAIYLIASLTWNRLLFEAIPKKGEKFFVGRTHEQEELSHFLSDAQAVECMVVFGCECVGKSALVEHALSEHQCKYSIFNYADDKYDCYDKICQSIIPKMADFFASMILGKDFSSTDDLSKLPFRETNPISILKGLLKTSDNVIVIDNFNGFKDEIDKFISLSSNLHVKVILISTDDPGQGIPSLKVEPMTPEELTNVFYAYNIKETLPRQDQDTIREIAKKLYGQVSLMQLIATWYRYLALKSGDPGVMDASEALKELLKKMQDDDLKKLQGDKEYHPSPGSSEKKLAGHIRDLALLQLSSNRDRSTYLILSCFSGVPIARHNLLDWFNFKDADIDSLCRKGLALSEQNGDAVEVRIPKLLATLNYRNDADRKDKSDWDWLYDFMLAFMKAVRHEECGVIDLDTVGEVSEKIIRLLAERQQYVQKNSQYKQRISLLFLDCIRYFLLLCERDRAQALYDDLKDVLSLDENSLADKYVIVWMDALLGGEIHVLTSFEKIIKRKLPAENQLSQQDWESIRAFAKLYLDIIWSNIERKSVEESNKASALLEMCQMMYTYTQLFCLADLSVTSKSLPVFSKTSCRYMIQYNLLSVYLTRNNLAMKQQNTLLLQHELKKLESMLNSLIPNSRYTRIEIFELFRIICDSQFILTELFASLEPSESRMNIVETLKKLQDKKGELYRQYQSIVPEDLQRKIECVNMFMCKKGLELVVCSDLFLLE